MYNRKREELPSGANPPPDILHIGEYPGDAETPVSTDAVDAEEESSITGGGGSSRGTYLPNPKFGSVR